MERIDTIDDSPSLHLPRKEDGLEDAYLGRKGSLPLICLEKKVATAFEDFKKVTIENGKLPEKEGKEEKEKNIEERHISDIFLKTDINGLPEIYESKTWANRIWWTIILLIAVFFLIIELYSIYVSYRDNPILTTHSVVSEQDGLQLPTVYICPLSPIHQDQRKKINVPKWWETQRNVSKLFQSSGLSDSEGDPDSILGQKQTVWDEIEVAAEEAGRDVSECDLLLDGVTTTQKPEYIPRDIEDYFMHVGYPLKTLFKECAFATESLKCSDIVEEVFDRDYGKCFLLKNDGFMQRLPGLGISLVLNLDTRHAFSSDPPLFDGLVMKIEHKFDLAGYRKLLLHPSRYTIMNLAATKYTLIEQERPFGASQQCRDADEGQENLMIINSSYTLGVCRMDCTQSAVFSECSCVLPMSKRHMNPALFKNPDFERDPYCSYSIMKSCAFPLIMHKLENDLKFKDCYSKCKVPCEFWEYKSEVTSARFPSDMFLNPTATSESRKRKKREAEVRAREAEETYKRLKKEALRAIRNAKSMKRHRREAEESSTISQTTAATTSQTQRATTETSGDATDTDYYEYGYNSSGSTTERSSGVTNATAVTTNVSSDSTTTEQSTSAGAEDDAYYEYEYEEEESQDSKELEEARRRALEEKCFGKDPFSTQDWLDYIVVDIAYSNLQFTEITQEKAISFTQAVSDVGGQVGLWLGCSMISIIKIFIVTGPLVWMGARRRKKKEELGKMLGHEIMKRRMMEMMLKHAKEAKY